MIPEYQRRALGFIDILGFTDLINRMEADSELFKFVLGVLESIQDEVATLGCSAAIWMGRQRQSG